MGILLFLVVAIFVISALTFSDGILEEEAFLSTEPDSEQYYLKALDSPNASFSCQLGNDYDSCVQERFPNAQITMVSSWDDMVARLNYGRDTAILMENSSIAYLAQAVPTLYFFDEPIATSEYCYFTDKTERGTQLCAQLNAFVDEQKADGSMIRLQEKWLSSSEDDFSMEEVVFAEDAQTLNIAVEPDWPPFSYIMDQDYGPIGYFIDQLNLFCAQYGYIPNYISLTSADACALGVSSGKYDIGAVGLVYTPERAQAFSITEPVMADDIYVCVRASSVMGIDLQEYVGKTTFWKHMAGSLYQNLIAHDRWIMLLNGLWNTVVMSIGAVVLGTVLGALIYFLRRQKNMLLSSIARLYINIFQRMPQVLLLLILCYIVFTGDSTSGVMVCIVTFALSFAPFVAEMLRSGVDAIPEGQWKVAMALGFTKTQTFFKIILPQVMQIIMPVYKGDVVTLILETSIAGYIAVEDLTKMSDYIRASTFEPMTPMLVTALIYFLLTLCIGLALGQLEKLFNAQSRRRLPRWALQLKQKNV